ncbi:MAG: hypothetical protein QOD86_2142 [Miltoncostaeaceae bacterium]|jgi:hypothetical protein|nr:hypothetical protein [Miltoncostaeaceae bacterium]
MRRDLDALISEAREAVSPSAEATERARAAVRAATPAPRRSRLRPPRRHRLWVLGAAALVLGGGAATAAVVGTRGSGPPFVPAIENCYALEGSRVGIPRLFSEVDVDESGGALVAWVDLAGTIRAAERPASGAWGTPVEVAALGKTAPSEIAFSANARGDAAVAWIQGGRTMAAVRPAGESWGAPVDLTREGQEAAAAGRDTPGILVTEAGETLVTWLSASDAAVTRSGRGVSVSGELGHVEVAARPAGGDWGVARPIPGEATNVPALAEGASGRVAAVYFAGMSGRVLVADLDAATGAAQSVRSLRLPPTKARPRAYAIGEPVIADNGRGVLATSIMVNGRIAVWLADGAGWSAGRLVSPAGVAAGDPRVAVADDGRVLTAWTGVTRERRADGTTRRARTVYAAVSGGGADVTAARVSRLGRLASEPSVAFTGRGGVVTWADGTNGISGTDSRVEAAWVSAGGGGFERAMPLSTVGKGPLFPDVAVNAGGETVATWTRCTAENEAVMESAAAPAPGAEWSEPARIAP